MVLGLGGQNILSQIIEGAKHTILPLCPLNFLNIEGAAAPSALPITTPLQMTLGTQNTANALISTKSTRNLRPDSNVIRNLNQKNINHDFWTTKYSK